MQHDDNHSEYSDVAPSKFTGLNAYPEWVSKLPVEVLGTRGSASLYEDGRIDILLDLFSVKNRSILELGPFEAGHTYMMHNAGAHSIDAIEAHRSSYIKCLLAKEAFSLTRANFYFGDFIKWLKQPSKVYDLAVASGVLYHMADPIELLDLLCKSSNHLFLWTHYAPTGFYQEGDPLKKPYTGVVNVVDYKGIKLNLHQRTYLDVAASSTFCGGVRDRHAWMEREGILSMLKVNGFREQHIFMDQPNEHPNGPCFCVYAHKDFGSRS